mmetsp:Transcript_60187/g.143465  ORF Transcript_60187/g.143465 Transcript_60187/m.143465 type:complete len:90 (+) Transcript_60187:904-1173(+)
MPPLGLSAVCQMARAAEEWQRFLTARRVALSSGDFGRQRGWGVRSMGLAPPVSCYCHWDSVELVPMGCSCFQDNHETQTTSMLKEVKQL